jgi:Type I phosphodiesterase / nucleotide pyrophosphatase
MRYLRLLANAVAGAVLVSLYLAVLVLQLNPRVPVVSMTAVRWFGAVLALYVPYATVALFFLFLAREVMAARPLRPAWVSVRLLAWLGAVLAAMAASITWANLLAFEGMLTEAAVVRMRDGAWLTSGCAVALLVIAVARYSFARQGSRTTAAVLLFTLSVSVVGPLWPRGHGETPVRPPIRWSQPAAVVVPTRVRVILLEGASLGFIRQRVAAGQLSTLARILDRGAVIDLATVRPTEIGPVWTAAATGRLATSNGVRSNGVYRVSDADVDEVDILPDFCFAYALVSQRFVRATDHTSASLRSRPVWDILSDYRLTVGVVNWPLTFPAQLGGRGYLLSDRFDEAATSPLRLQDGRAGDPTTTVDIAREHFDRWQPRPWHEVLTTFSRGEVEPIDVNIARWDRAYSDTAAELERQFAPRFMAVRYEGLDAFGHNYLRQAQPELFGGPRWTVAIRPVLDRYYGYIDGEIAQAMRSLAPGDLLLVVSGFGMDPTPLNKRLLARLLGNRERTGTHESGPDGFLLAYGSHVASGSFPRGAMVDLAPTILYYLGVPVARDMDGFVRTDLFLPSYTFEHPVKYVASHER